MQDLGDPPVEGTAFGTAPAHGTLPNQQPVSGFQGKGLVNSFLGGDEPMGKMSSKALGFSFKGLTFGGQTPRTDTIPQITDAWSYFGGNPGAGRWGEGDELGTLNLIAPEKRIAAAQLVRVGDTVSCAWDIGGPNAMTPPARFYSRVRMR